MVVAAPHLGTAALHRPRPKPARRRERRGLLRRAYAAFVPLTMPLAVLGVLSGPVVVRLGGAVRMNTETRRTLDLKKRINLAREQQHHWESQALQLRDRGRVREWAERNGMVRADSGKVYIPGHGLHGSR